MALDPAQQRALRSVGKAFVNSIRWTLDSAIEGFVTVRDADKVVARQRARATMRSSNTSRRRPKSNAGLGIDMPR